MTIEIAREAGACFGVQRALDLAKKLSAEVSGPLYTLGPLIHNPRVVADLEAHGVKAIDDARDAGEGATMLLRTHGVSPSVERAAEEAGAHVVDATCPFVKKCHKLAERFAEEGYQVIVVGEHDHPEVEGTVGHAPEALVVEDASELASVTLARRVGVVVQTTQTQANLRAVVGALVGRVEELRLYDTICDATAKRQTAAAELAQRADVMVVIGGRNSANTTRLAEICAGICANTHHIEDAGELDAAWFAGAQLVGITAGASTPQEHIAEVHDAIERLVGTSVRAAAES